MGVHWMWGWEIGAVQTTYELSGWTAVNAWTMNPAQTADTFQPAAGYGGGSFALHLIRQDGNGTSRILTPLSGENSVGNIQRFIFHDGYKRVGGTPGNYLGRAFLRFLQNTTEVIRLSQNIIGVTSSPIDLYVNGVWLATTATYYTGTQPWHRVVLVADGASGNYAVYVNGILEINVTGSGETFASINAVEFARGCGTTGGVNGGYHDQAVMFNGGNTATGDLTMANNPLNNETVVIGVQTYTFKTTLTGAANEVLRDAAVAATSRRNLINAINLGPGAGTLYDAATTLNADVRAFEDTAATAVHVKAKIIGTGPNSVVTTDTLTGGGDGWGGGTLSGGDSNPANDLALALGQIFIQGFLPDSDVSAGSWDTQPLGGQPLYNNINDGTALSDFIETTTSPDAYIVGHQGRSDINPSFAPSQVHAVQTIQISRASGAITSGRTTVDVPSIGTIIGDSTALSASSIMVNDLWEWRGNATTDIDGLETGQEV
jgi:hypothetical protein